jgi:hypothetical protein
MSLTKCEWKGHEDACNSEAVTVKLRRSLIFGTGGTVVGWF